MVRASCALWVVLSGCGGFTPLDGGPDASGDLSPSPFSVVQGVPEGETLTAVWGADAQHLFAVGSNAVRLLYFDGAWHRYQNESGTDYFCLAGFSATDVYTAGAVTGNDTGTVVHFDGSHWIQEYAAPTALYGLWSDGNVLLAVGAQGMIYGKKLGTTTWQQVQSPSLPPNPDVPSDADSPLLWGIAGNSFGDFAMPADRDRVFHMEGMTGIAYLDPSVDTTINFRSVWAPPGTSNDFFFGTNYLGVIWLTAAPPTGLDMVADQMYTLYRDASLPGADSLFIHGIWGNGAKILFAGDLGHIFVYDAGANQFSNVPSPASGNLWGVWGSSPDDVWIVGEREVILHGRIP